MFRKLFSGILADRSSIRLALPLYIFACSIFSFGITIAADLHKAYLFESTQAEELFVYITWGKPCSCEH